MKNKYKKFAYTVQQLELKTGGGDSMIGLCLQSITVGRQPTTNKTFFSSDFPKLGPVLKKIIKLLLHFNLNKALETFGDKKDQNKKNLTNKTRQNKTKPNHYNSKHECTNKTRRPPKSLPEQSVPFPVNPSLQVQMYEPSLFKQSAFSSHGLPFVVHSSMSETNRLLFK